MKCRTFGGLALGIGQPLEEVAEDLDAMTLVVDVFVAEAHGHVLALATLPLLHPLDDCCRCRRRAVAAAVDSRRGRCRRAVSDRRHRWMLLLAQPCPKRMEEDRHDVVLVQQSAGTAAAALARLVGHRDRRCDGSGRTTVAAVGGNGGGGGGGGGGDDGRDAWDAQDGRSGLEFGRQLCLDVAARQLPEVVDLFDGLLAKRINTVCHHLLLMAVAAVAATTRCASPALLLLLWLLTTVVDRDKRVGQLDRQ